MNLDTLRPLYPQHKRIPLSAVQIISLHLLLHKPTGEEDSLDPAFGPYISTLPRDFASHPLAWLVDRRPRPEKLAEELFLRNLPPSVSDVLHALYARFLEDYQTVCLYLVSVVHLRIPVAMRTSHYRTSIAMYLSHPVVQRQTSPSHSER